MTLPQRLLLLTALAAVMWAQAFGLHRGYYCPCPCLPAGGHLTLVDHCHADAAEEAHHDHDHSLPHHHDGDDAETVSHEHQAVIDSLVAHQLAIAPILAPAPVFNDLGFAWIDAPPVIPALARQPLAPPPDPHHPPLTADWPRLLSQTISLRL